MTPRVWAAWLPPALFLLQALGCLSLSGPRHVTGTVGGSLSVQCRYEEEFRGNKKYWCGDSCSILKRNKIVETTGSEREERSGRVSIRDHPANLTFTVTLENLTEDDEGTYWCGIDVPWLQLVDHMFQVVGLCPQPPRSPRRSSSAPWARPPPCQQPPCSVQRGWRPLISTSTPGPCSAASTSCS